MPITEVKPLYQSVCEAQDDIADDLADLDVNLFAERILTRMLDGACWACENDYHNLAEYFLSSFVRYLSRHDYTDDDQRELLMRRVIIMSKFPCGLLPCSSSDAALDVEGQMITSLDARVSQFIDARSPSDREAAELDATLDVLGVPNSVLDPLHEADADLHATPTVCAIKIRPGEGACDARDGIVEDLVDLDVNLFAQRILTRLIDGACWACENDNEYLASYFLRSFGRYLSRHDYTDECMRRAILVRVDLMTRFPCGRDFGPLSEADDELIIALDSKVSKLLDAKASEEAAEDLDATLDILGVPNSVVDPLVEDVELHGVLGERMYTICVQQELIASNLDEMGINLFAERIINRLVSTACWACENGHRRLAEHLIRSASRMLMRHDYVDEDLQRRTIITLLKSRRCRAFYPGPPDVESNIVNNMVDQHLIDLARASSKEGADRALIDLLDRIESGPMNAGSTTSVAELVAFPNPTSDLINLSKTVEEVQILNSTGQLILRAFGTQSIDLTSLPNGVYLLRSLDDGLEKNTRIVKH